MIVAVVSSFPTTSPSLSLSLSARLSVLQQLLKRIEFYYKGYLHVGTTNVFSSGVVVLLSCCVYSRFCCMSNYAYVRL